MKVPTTWYITITNTWWQRQPKSQGPRTPKMSKSMNIENMNKEVPRELRLSGAESSLEGDKSSFARCKELSDNLHQMRDESMKAMLDLLGSKSNEYFEFQRKLRERSSEIRSLFTPTPDGEKMRDAFKRKSLAETREFIKTLKINPSDIKLIQKNYQTQARLIAEKEMDIADSPYVDTTTTNFPKRSNNPWTWMIPPYFGTYGFQYSDRSGGGGVTVSHYENAVTGELNCTSYMGDNDAGDYDYYFATARSTILVWYRMPVTGLVETWADLQSIDTYYNGWLHDEWGFSNAGVQQLSRAYLQVVYPSEGRERFGTLLDYRRGESEGSWSGNVTWPGSHLYPHLFSIDVYPAGQWVLMRIGVTDFHNVWIDDMAFGSGMVNRWFIRDIPIRSTGVE
jgi:hypothetical protein